MERPSPVLPRISVVLPVRDAGSHLVDCLQSLLFQNYSPIEIIAIDDFSRDNSWQILKEFKKIDSRLRIFRNVKAYGLATTLNRALKRAKGELVVFMDPNDQISANKLTKQYEALLRHEKAVAVGTQAFLVGKSGKRIGKTAYPLDADSIAAHPLHGASLLCEGLMIHRKRIPKDLLSFPLTPGALLYSDMTLKLLQYGDIINLPEYLHTHRTKKIARTQMSTFLYALSRAEHGLHALKLWMTARFTHNHSYTPPLRTLIGGILKPTV
jgi:glycosyltransferase involved in cell wall biosynthesis